MIPCSNCLKAIEVSHGSPIQAYCEDCRDCAGAKALLRGSEEAIKSLNSFLNLNHHDKHN